MRLKARVLCPQVPCKMCKYFNNEVLCTKVYDCVKCENFGENGCHCLELVPDEETTCPYFTKNEAEE